MRSWFGLSISLHALVGASLFFSFQQEKISTEVVAIDFQPIAPPSQTDSLGKSERAKAGRSQGSAQRARLAQNLLRSYDLSSASEIDHAASSGDSDISEGLLGDTDDWSFHEQVYKKVDAELIFDSLLAQYNHFGVVTLKFWVDQKGYLVEKSLKAEAEDRILQVHSIRAVRRALAQGFPSSKWSHGSHGAYFIAKFNFAFGEFKNTKQKGFAQPYLSFLRTTTERPIPNTLEEHLMAGGIDYDLFAATERWQKYNKKKRLRQNEFDPFAHYKEDSAYNL